MILITNYIKLKCGDIMTSIRHTNFMVRHNRGKFILSHHIPQNSLKYRDVVKISDERNDNKVICTCTKRISMCVQTDFVICRCCGKKVFNTTKNHFKYKLRKLKEGD